MEEVKVTVKLVADHGACDGGMEWFLEHEDLHGKDFMTVLKALVEDKQYSYAKWALDHYARIKGYETWEDERLTAFASRVISELSLTGMIHEDNCYLCALSAACESGMFQQYMDLDTYHLLF
jgi:hypothetical protein